MHGRRGDSQKRRRHMWTDPPLGPTPVADPSLNFFFKDGRKVSVGDCALFQARNSPPFIGIIRSLTVEESDNLLKLSVNWLYRPGDIKLSKGTLLEAVPNEVFYSFHKDEISAASLLHPCKVAFLRKGVKLPLGLSSFVCRRVYDIANKRLWWLTDQDYINERQEEVDQLLDKTRLDMHAALQSGDRSPKPLNGSASTQQVKSGSDNSVQNSSNSVPHQGKGKKRERGDQGVENLRRERSKVDEGDPSSKLESSIKSEIGGITDKEGGLVNCEAVEKLVQLMQLDRVEKKIDLTGRIMLADVIAATDKDDYLGQFVQLHGVPVLDDWLQEAHKGKIGEGSSPTENDKSIEELLLSLLRALDKLPVNLHALQTCNVGKSVNQLRSHKNLEIHKKARILVDTWKKRVEAEMKMDDAKSGQSQTGSWSGKPGGTDVCHGGNRRSVTPAEAIVKSSVTQQSTSKASARAGHVDPVIKSTLSSSPGSIKLATFSPSSTAMISKQGSDMHLTPIKEDRSSSSSQSQSNSHSCSSDLAKNVSSGCKDDARSTNAGSINASKNLNCSSHSRKSSNGYVNSGVSGVQKEAGNVKSGTKIALPDKVSQAVSMSEKIGDVAIVDHGNSQRLIVRLPRSMSGGTSEYPSATGSRASSPIVTEKVDSHDRKIKGKDDFSRSSNTGDMNNESWQSNDLKDGFGGSDEGDGSPTALPDDHHSKTAEENNKPINGSRGVPLSSENESICLLSKQSKLYESSLSSINALIESCVKDSEDTSVPLPVGDNMGMNLLASVAAGEMSKSELTSSNSSPRKTSASAVDATDKHEGKSRLAFHDSLPEGQGQPDETACKFGKENLDTGSSPVEAVSDVNSNNASLESGNRSVKFCENNVLKVHTIKSVGSDAKLMYAINVDEVAELGQDTCLKNLEPERVSSLDGKILKAHVDHELTEDDDKKHDGLAKGNMKGIIEVSGVKVIDLKFEGKQEENNVSVASANGDAIPSAKECRHRNNESVCNLKHVAEGDENSNLPIGLGRMDLESGINKPVKQELPFRTESQLDIDTTDKKPTSSEGLMVKSDKDVEKITHLSSADENPQDLTVIPAIPDDRVKEYESEKNEEHSHKESFNCDPTLPPAVSPQEISEKCLTSMESKLLDVEAVKEEKLVANIECSTSMQETGSKIDFDLNEGFPADEGSHRDVVTSSTSSRPSSVVHLHSSSTVSVTPTTSLPASITVAAAAKGYILPPEVLLRSKGELGWKGAAATSAFRRAEPRKYLETSHTTTAEGLISDSSTGKKGRPWLDFDLNVPDDRVLEDTSRQTSVLAMCESRLMSNSATLCSSGALGLDLNKVDESNEQGMQFQSSISRRLEVLAPMACEPSSSGFGSEVKVLRDFDLNDGPDTDEAAALDSISRNQHQKNSVPFMPAIPGVRVNNAELGGFSSWLPAGGSLSAMAIPSFLPDRGEQQPFSIVTTAGAPQRMLGPASGGAFGADVYQAPMLSSSPMPYSAASAPFHYAGFHFGTSFSVPSTSFSVASSSLMDSSTIGSSCFPAVPSQLVGPGGALTTHYPRPYIISLPDVITASGGSDSNRKWNQQGCLDLNTGPGSADGEATDERLQSHLSRQISIGSSQAFSEEQARLYQAVKRKEPEGGWAADRLNYKQPSWQ